MFLNSVQFSFVEYDGCFLVAPYYILAAVEGSTQENHPGSTHNYLLMAGILFLETSFFDIINGSECMHQGCQRRGGRTGGTVVIQAHRKPG